MNPRIFLFFFLFGHCEACRDLSINDALLSKSSRQGATRRSFNENSILTCTNILIGDTDCTNDDQVTQELREIWVDVVKTRGYTTRGFVLVANTL